MTSNGNMKPAELLIYEQAVRNTALYALRKQQDADKAKNELNIMIKRLENYYARTTQANDENYNRRSNGQHRKNYNTGT